MRRIGAGVPPPRASEGRRQERTRRALPRRLSVLSALVVCAGFIAASCSADDDHGADPGPSTSVASPDVDPDGIVRVGYDIRQQTGGGWFFDPTEMVSSVHQGWISLMYGTLLRPVLDGPPVPDLAESTSVPDRDTIEITLREGLTFSDGTPFDAEAVAAGLLRSKEADNRAAFTAGFFDLESATVTSPTTLTLEIADGKAPGWHDQYLAGFQSAIVKPGQTDFSTGTIGAGPLTVTSYRPDQSVSFVRNDRYWDVDSVQVGGVEIVQVATDQPQTGTAALRADQIDLVLTSIDQISALTGDLELFSQPDPNQNVQMFMCKSEGPLADRRVRLAINKAVDRVALGEAVFAGTTQPAHGLWPDDHRFHNPDIDDVLAYDQDEARTLLAEAGYADGFSLDFYMTSGGNIPEAAEVIQAQLEEVGIETNIIIPANFVADFLDPPRPGVALVPGNAAGRDKLNAFSGDGLGNVCDWSDPELDALIVQLAGVSASSDEAVELWHEIEAEVVNEALNGWFLIRSRTAGYNTERIATVALHPLGTVIVPDVFTIEVTAQT
jgi:ABC-type transport system substrate-binding protein